MNKFIILSLLIGAAMCFNQTNITVIPSQNQTATNYKDLNTLLQNVTQACGQVDNCNIYLANDVTHTISTQFSYGVRTTILFIRPVTDGSLVTIQLNNSISLSLQGNVQFIGIKFTVPKQISPAVFILQSSALLSVTDSQYSNINFTQQFATATAQGGVSLKNFTASVNIQGSTFVSVDNGSLSIDGLVLNNVAGYQNDVILSIKNTNSVNLNNFNVNQGNVSVMNVQNSQVNISKGSVIKGLTQPSYVILLTNGSQLVGSDLVISNIDLSKSAYQSVIRAEDSRVQLSQYFCSSITSQYYPCLYVLLTKKEQAWANVPNTIPIQQANWNNNQVTGSYSGQAFIVTYGFNSYYYQQFNSQKQILGSNACINNNYANTKLDSSICIRFSGQYDLKVTVSKADGSGGNVNNNTYFIYNVNPSIALINSLSLQYTDVIGQTFDDKSQMYYINNTNNAMYLVAPHKNVSYTINQQQNNSLQANASQLISAIRGSDIFRSTYLIPSQAQCAQNKTFVLKNNITFNFDGLTANILTGPLVDSPSTTWYLVANMNLDSETSDSFQRSYNNFIQLNGSMYVLPLKTSDKTCDNGQGLICKTNQFVNSTDGCQDCDSSCGTCSAFGKDKCITCSNSILVSQNGRCVCDTGDQVLINGVCYDKGAAKTLVDSYDFSTITNITDLQVKYRIALNYAQAISLVGLNVSTASSPCGQRDQCSGQGSCQESTKTCKCLDNWSGSLCQFQTNEYNNMLIRAINASQSLAVIASRVSAQDEIQSYDMQNEILATVLLTQILDSLNIPVLRNLNDVTNYITQQANKDLTKLSLTDFEDLIDQLDLILYTSNSAFNTTTGALLTNQLYNNLQTNINSRIKKDKSTMQQNLNSPVSFASDRVTVQYTMLDFKNFNNTSYLQAIGSNNITLPAAIMLQLKKQNDVGSQIVYKVVKFNYNPRLIQDNFQAQSEIVQSQVFYGPDLIDFPLDSNSLSGSQSIQLSFSFDAKYTNARCYSFNNITKLWHFKSNGNFNQSLLCAYNQFGLFAASNSTQGTLSSMLLSFQYAIVAVVGLLYVLIQ